MFKAIVADEREMQFFQENGLQKIFGYFLLLRWQSAGGAPIHSSVRKLKPVFGVSDYNTVSVILAKMQEKGLVELKQSAAGTDIFFPDFLSVRKNTTAADKKPLSPVNPLNPEDETLNFNNHREINFSTGCGGKNGQPKRKLNALQQFSNRVIEEFENLNPEQKAVWFRRNCRCLSDILKFCGGDIELALQTVRECVIKLDKLGWQGGYEAVCRNLPMYYKTACKTLNRSEKCN